MSMTAERKRERANEIFSYLDIDDTPNLLEDAIYRLNGIANSFDDDDMTDEDITKYLAYYATCLREIAEQLTGAMGS